MKNAYVDQGRLPSFLLSLCLHLALFALALFWPAPDPLPTPSMSPTVAGFVTIGKEGRLAQSRKVDGPDRPEPSVQPKRIDAQPPQPQKVEQRVPPEVKPERKPVEKPVPKTPEKELPPDVTPIAAKKEPPRNATVKSTRNATAKAPARNATASRNAGKKESAADALADLRKQTRSAGGPSGRQGSGDAVKGALSALGKSVGGGSGTDADGDGPGGSGGDGAGILGSYEDSVRSRVKPNWNWVERADRKQYVAMVNLRISPTGEVQGVRVVQSSGNSLFDSSVVTAVRATQTLEAPPRPDLRELNILFNSADMAR